jgi:hypothetical protein
MRFFYPRITGDFNRNRQFGDLITRALSGSKTPGKPAGQELIVRDYKNYTLNGELQNFINTKAQTMAIFDLDFIGEANHISTKGAENIKYNILERLNKAFGGEVIFYQKSCKFIAVINKPGSLEVLQAKINKILALPELYQYTEKNGGKANMAVKMGREPLTMVKGVVGHTTKGSNFDKIINSSLAKIRTLKNGISSFAFPAELNTQGVSLATEVSQETLKEIAGKTKIFLDAAAGIKTIPADLTAYQTSLGNKFSPAAKNILTQAYLDHWTRQEFNTFETNEIIDGQKYQVKKLPNNTFEIYLGDQPEPVQIIENAGKLSPKLFKGPERTILKKLLNRFNDWHKITSNLAYNKNAFKTGLDTLNKSTISRLRKAKALLHNEKDLRLLDNELKKEPGSKLSARTRHLLSNFEAVITSDGASIGAQNNWKGWTATDLFNYSYMCEEMNLGLQKKYPGLKVITYVTGGDEFAFKVIFEKPLTPEQRKKVNIELKNIFNTALANINEKNVTVPKKAVLHSFITNKTFAEYYWQKALEFATLELEQQIDRSIKKYADKNNLSLTEARPAVEKALGVTREQGSLRVEKWNAHISPDVITMKNGNYPYVHNKAKLDVVNLMKDPAGKQILTVLKQEGLILQKQINEAIASRKPVEIILKFETAPPRRFEFLLELGIIKMRRGTTANGAVLPENIEGLNGKELLAFGDDLAQAAKSRGQSCLTPEEKLNIKTKALSKVIDAGSIFNKLPVRRFQAIMAKYNRSYAAAQAEAVLRGERRVNPEAELKITEGEKIEAREGSRRAGERALSPDRSERGRRFGEPQYFEYQAKALIERLNNNKTALALLWKDTFNKASKTNKIMMTKIANDPAYKGLSGIFIGLLAMKGTHALCKSLKLELNPGLQFSIDIMVGHAANAGFSKFLSVKFGGQTAIKEISHQALKYPKSVRYLLTGGKGVFQAVKGLRGMGPGLITSKAVHEIAKALGTSESTALTLGEVSFFIPDSGKIGYLLALKNTTLKKLIDTSISKGVLRNIAAKATTTALGIRALKTAKSFSLGSVLLFGVDLGVASWSSATSTKFDSLVDNTLVSHLDNARASGFGENFTHTVGYLTNNINMFFMPASQNEAKVSLIESEIPKIRQTVENNLFLQAQEFKDNILLKIGKIRNRYQGAEQKNAILAFLKAPQTKDMLTFISTVSSHQITKDRKITDFSYVAAILDNGREIIANTDIPEESYITDYRLRKVALGQTYSTRKISQEINKLNFLNDTQTISTEIAVKADELFNETLKKQYLAYFIQKATTGKEQYSAELFDNKNKPLHKAIFDQVRNEFNLMVAHQKLTYPAKLQSIYEKFSETKDKTALLNELNELNKDNAILIAIALFEAKDQSA